MRMQEISPTATLEIENNPVLDMESETATGTIEESPQRGRRRLNEVQFDEGTRICDFLRNLSPGKRQKQLTLLDFHHKYRDAILEEVQSMDLRSRILVLAGSVNRDRCLQSEVFCAYIDDEGNVRDPFPISTRNVPLTSQHIIFEKR